MLKERTKTGRIIYEIGFGQIELEMARKVLVVEVLGQNLAAKCCLYQNLLPALALLLPCSCHPLLNFFFLPP